MKLEMKAVLSKLVAQRPTIIPRKLKKRAIKVEVRKIKGTLV